MNTRGLKEIGFLFIFMIATLVFQSRSYAQEEIPKLTASVETPLSEATLQRSRVTLTLSGGRFIHWEPDIEDALTVTSIDGVTIDVRDVDRISDTEVRVLLKLYGNIDTDTTLTFTLGADAIREYDGAALTAQLPVTAVEEKLTASIESPLTETTLDGSLITLTLSGRHFGYWGFKVPLTVSGVDGVTIDSWNVDRISDTEVTVELSFSGDIDTDATLTLAVEAWAFAYDKAFTFEFPVSAIEEKLTASTETPLTEATLEGSVVTLTLSGRSFVESEFDIAKALTFTGVEGVTVGRRNDRFFTFSRVAIDRVSDTKITVELSFDGTDFDTDATLTVSLGAGAIAEYRGVPLTAQLPVTARKQSNATVRLSPNPIVSPLLDGQFTVSLTITGGTNVAGFQATVVFDYQTLRYMESAKGDYLPGDPFFDSWKNYFSDSEAEKSFPHAVQLVSTALEGVSNGNGTLATLTFEVIDVATSTLTVSDVYIVDREGIRWKVEVEGTEVIEPANLHFGDVNRDGSVNSQDLTFVHLRFGQRGNSWADVNSDGIVDIVDLVLVANELGADAAAPARNPQILDSLTAADVKGWLTQAQQLTYTDPKYLRGINVLEQLLAALTPKETSLLPNYPNPFNPETWIPYQLSKPADVTLTIYAIDGQLVRQLDLGHQPAGMYQSRSRAAYWDGRNEFGEPVASGIYFYTLSTESTRDSVTAGDFSATRKMLIRK